LDVAEKQSFIRLRASQNEDDPEGAYVLWSRHAITELVNEGWSRKSVEQALRNCESVEDYPEGRRTLPDCLALCRQVDDVPVHAVVAIDEARERILLVTVYRPSTEAWKDDWRTRKHDKIE
jgi:hypothetical protein